MQLSIINSDYMSLFLIKNSKNVYLFRFKTIAALHSELLAVSTSGYLYQWCWTDLVPQRADNPTGNHPRYRL